MSPAPFSHWISMYAIPRRDYGEVEKARFAEDAVPKIREWISASLATLDKWPEQIHKKYGMNLSRGEYKDWEICWR